MHIIIYTQVLYSTLYRCVAVLTVNSPVLGSNPTCTVCSKSMGDDISGLSFPVRGETRKRGGKRVEGSRGEGERGRERDTCRGKQG